MKMYITFGQCHAHRLNGKTLDCDCVGVINGKDEEECNKFAFKWMDGRFHEHTIKVPDEKMMLFYPRGLIEIN